MPSQTEVGVGILNTQLTWEDLQQVCFEVFGESAVFGPNKGATRIGDGRGCMSFICLIDPDWKEDTEFPEQFVVKICTQLAMTEAHEKFKGESEELNSMMDSVGDNMQKVMTESIRMMHSHEVNVYNLIQKYNIAGLPVPKVYKAVKFTDECKQGFILMEYIDEAVNLNIYDNVGVEDVKQALKGLAALEAASLKFTDEERNSLPSSTFKKLYDTMADPTLMKVTTTLLKQFSKEEVHPKIDQLAKVYPELMDVSALEIGPELGVTPVLIQGDTWSSNLLWKKEKRDNLKLAAIVDFQTSRFGHPAVDLLRLLGSTLSGKDRHRNWEELIEYFYNELLQELKGAPAPFTLEQLKENCRRFYPMAGALLIPMMGPIFQMNQQNPDEEAKSKILDSMSEKAKCLIDDMLFYHERNQKLKAEKHK